MATVGEALELSIGDGDPPQLVGAVDRGAEGEPAAILRRLQSGTLAACQVAAHPGARHQVVPGREVPARRGRRVRPIRREQPDVVAAPGATLESMPERRDRRAVRKPRRGSEMRPRTAGHRRHGPCLDVDHVDVEPGRDEVGVAPAVRCEGDPSAVGRPGGLAIRGAAVGQARGLAGGDVDQPQVIDLVVGEPRAVEHVVEPIEEPIVRRRWRAAARFGLPIDATATVVVGPGRAVRGADDDQPVPSGDHSKASTPRGRSVSRRASPPSSGSR